MGLKESGLRGSLRNVSVGIVAIPDPDVYLNDDWGDNKLQDREDSDTTTHNGVEGVYRPEWTLDEGSPSASNQTLQLDSGDAVRTGITLALSETVPWQWTGVEFPATDAAGDTVTLQLWAESTTRDTQGFGLPLQSGYFIQLRDSSPEVRLIEMDSSGNTSELITGSATAGSGFDLSVTRSSDGGFELFVEGSIQGTSTDTTHTDPQYFSFGTRSGTDASLTVSEVKIN